MGLKLSIEPVCELEQKPADRRFRIARPVYVDGRGPAEDGLVVDAETGTIADPDDLDPFSAPPPEIDLPPGSVVVPGFHDAHNHWFWSLFRDAVSLAGVTRPDEAVHRITSRVDRQAGGWILAVDRNTALLPSGALTIDDLDRVSRVRPVLVFDASYHGALVNSAAMSVLAPAFAKEPDLRGDCRNGLLTEDYVGCAMTRMTADPATLREAVRGLQAEFFRLGITSFDDMDLLGAGHQLREMLIALYETGDLTIPCRAWVQPRMVRDGVRPAAYADGRFEIAGVKDYADGSLGSWTAAMCTPYADDYGGDGLRMLPPERFARRLDLCRRAGFDRYAVHAIGDRGILDAVGALEEARKAGIADPHHLRIEHFEIPSEDALHRTRDLGISVCSQPAFLSDATTYAARLGPARAAEVCPHDAILRAGIPLAFGSDGMPHDPVAGLAAAVLREDGHAVTVRDALHAYTEGARRVSGGDAAPGGLRPGMAADFVVLDADIVKNPGALRGARVLQTWLGGEKVYDIHDHA